MTSVLQDWVMDLPLREQGTLLTGVRGCDTTPKMPLNSTERWLTAYLRFTFMNPADPREVGFEPGAFFQPTPPPRWKPSELGHYPLHWVAHLMHGFEVVGYRHPDPNTRMEAWHIYADVARSLHLNIETDREMTERLSEDRIATGTVVS